MRPICLIAIYRGILDDDISMNSNHEVAGRCLEFRKTLRDHWYFGFSHRVLSAYDLEGHDDCYRAVSKSREWKSNQGKPYYHMKIHNSVVSRQGLVPVVAFQIWRLLAANAALHNQMELAHMQGVGQALTSSAAPQQISGWRFRNSHSSLHHI